MSTTEKIFITGGSGFIGKALIELLLAEGFTVNALVHQSLDISTAQRLTTTKGSILDRDSLMRGMENCSTIFHLAAMVSFAPADQQELLDINQKGTDLLLSCALESGVNKVVVTSSACTLGVHPNPVPVNEDTVCNAEWRKKNVYLHSKRAQEEVCLAYHKRGLNVVMVLPTNVFGPGDLKMNSGIFFKQCSGGPFVIVPPGGTSVIDINDVARGHLAALKYGTSGERYVLTSDNLTFRELYNAVCLALGSKIRLITLPEFSKPLFKSAAWGYCTLKNLAGTKEWQLTPQIIEDAFAFKWYSAAKARRELKWAPSSSFANSLQKALAFYREKGLL